MDTDRGKESLVVVAETKIEGDTVASLRKDVAEQVVRAAGLPAKDIVLVASGTLPKTSSGKLQRSLCKERYVAGQLDLVSA